jgi:hypothetical protein
MADKLSYIQITEQQQHISFLKDMPELEDDDRTRLEQYLKDLSSRQENKFDNIIGMIKKCDAYIDALENEASEIKANLEAWKKNKDKLVNLIKFAYQQNLIGNKPTGVKYQGVFRRLKPRLVDNFEHWEEKERTEYGLRKTVTVTRIKDDTVVEVKQEDVPDKDRLQKALVEEADNVPIAAELVPGYSFTYERRKRLTAG